MLHQIQPMLFKVQNKRTADVNTVLMATELQYFQKCDDKRCDCTEKALKEWNLSLTLSIA